MSEISVVMAVFNSELYLVETIESVLKQSFDNFEFIIVDYGSTDKTLSIINTFKDKRIKLIESENNYISSLNRGISSANGKYIARMDTGNIMHVDRLKVQYAVMEEEKDITVCGTWMTNIGTNLFPDNIARTLSGLIEMPLLMFLRENYLFHTTIIMRTEFLIQHRLKYKEYPYTEDFKLWTEIAKLGGQFYIDNQPLLYYRWSDDQIKKGKQQSFDSIVKEILDYLICKNKTKYPELLVTLNGLEGLQQSELITNSDTSAFFQNLFIKNNHILTIL